MISHLSRTKFSACETMNLFLYAFIIRILILTRCLNYSAFFCIQLVSRLQNAI
jgi:hypothetical protein